MKAKSSPIIDLSFIASPFFKARLDDYLNYIFKLDIEIKGILLFGSVSRAEAKNADDYTSDIDLIIVCDDLPKDRTERKDYTFELTKSVSGGIQELWWTTQEFKSRVQEKYYLILDALDEGKILYDPKNLLHSLKKSLFLELAEKGVIKRKLYWEWPIKFFGEKIEF